MLGVTNREIREMMKSTTRSSINVNPELWFNGFMPQK
jgi:hypothetical protein